MPSHRSWLIATLAAAAAAVALSGPDASAGWIGVAALAVGALALAERGRRAGPDGSVLTALAIGLLAFTGHVATTVALDLGHLEPAVAGPVSAALACTAIALFTAGVITVIGPEVRQGVRVGPLLASDLIVTFSVAQVWVAVSASDGTQPSLRTTLPLSVVSLGCAALGAVALWRHRPGGTRLWLAIPAFDISGMVYVVARQLGWSMPVGAVGCVGAAAAAVWVGAHPKSPTVFRAPSTVGHVHGSWRAVSWAVALASPFVAWPLMTLTGGPSVGFSMVGAVTSIGFLVGFTLSERGDRRDAAAREAVAGELASDLRADAFVLHYQPVVHAGSGRVTGVEALLRWRSKHRPELGTEPVVEIAIEHGLAQLLSSRVVARVLDDLPVIRAAIGPATDPYIAINITTHDLEDPGFALWFERLLAGRDPSGLVLELSEKLPISHPDTVRRTIDALHSLGVAIALDDFGVGVANAAAAGAFDFDYVKLDRSLVVNAARSLRAERFLQGLTDSLRSLDVGVVAEGIEYDDQLSVPRGIDLLQGWAYGMPAALAELSDGPPVARSA